MNDKIYVHSKEYIKWTCKVNIKVKVCKCKWKHKCKYKGTFKGIVNVKISKAKM